jgi:hypothetical protein
MFVATALERLANDPKTPEYAQLIYQHVAGAIGHACRQLVPPLRFEAENEQAEAHVQDVFDNNRSPVMEEYYRQLSMKISKKTNRL